ncbi:MAG TPA: carboxypeptidase-like regulatory domain-containing protein [Candidatus Acidoferrales bacterium]|nr:carboxypeptidase-like regulatory domain-containing protein [Candidatus Acidoferrales bacterium]
MSRKAIRIFAAMCFAALHLCSAAASRAQLQSLPEQNPRARGRAAEIVLPRRLESGKPATLAVLDDQGQLAPGVTVELSTDRRVTTDATGRARFVVTSAPGSLTATVVGSTVRAWAKILSPANVGASSVMIKQCPSVILPTEHFGVSGFNFRPDADENRVKLGAQPALVLAASPLALEILPSPQTALGRANLQVETGAGNAATEVDVVRLRIENESNAATPSKPGEKLRLAVRVEGSSSPLTIAVWNQSPEVIEIEKGNLQRVTTRGGKPNQAELSVRTLHGGKFSISARPAPATAAPTDLELIRRELEAARGLATGDWAARVDAAIERLGQNEPAIASVQGDLERVLLENPPAPMGRHVETAWLAFLR